MSQLKEELRALIAEIAEKDEIPDDTHFKELGIDSMMGVEIVAAIERQYQMQDPRRRAPAGDDAQQELRARAGEVAAREARRRSVKSRHGFHKVRVAYVDTDRAQVVHHGTYFRFLEVARVEFWREQGFDYARFEKETGLGLPVVEARMRYRAAARFDNLLEVETWIARASRASVWFDAVIRKDGELIHESSVRLACAHFAEGTIRSIPKELLDACLEPGHGIAVHR